MCNRTHTKKNLLSSSFQARYHLLGRDNVFANAMNRRPRKIRTDSPPYQANGRRDAGPLKFIDLFCGIGGFRFAFENAGCECVFSCDWNEKALETYKANFKVEDKELARDIYSVGENAIERHDILCAGFPCQPFSIAGVSKKLSLGRKHGFEDREQGNLFFKIADIINKLQPSAFVLENVKNLKSHDKGNTYRRIMDILKDKLGYYVPPPQIIDAQGLVPQHRERIFIVGFSKPRKFEFPSFPKEGPKLETILENEVAEKYTLSDHLWKYLQDYAAKHKAAGNGFGFGLFTGKDVARTLSARYYKDGSEILISQGPGKNPRRLTPLECARLMGFDRKFIGRKFEIPVSDTQAYKQLGNSVVVPVVERIAKAVVETLQRPLDNPEALVATMADNEDALAANRTAVRGNYPKGRRKQKSASR
jgi:DNA (cytosine-5)-methyltransferase 1